jgi:hypothetical protein
LQTPSQYYVAVAEATHDITDTTGRVLTIRPTNTLDRLRLFKALGPTLSENDRYLGLACLAFAVTAIDAVPMPQPTNEAQLEAAIHRIGDAGIEAIAATLRQQDTATANPGN